MVASDLNYQFDLPVDDEQLRAIGMVAVEWSYLESIMDYAIGTFAGLSDDDRLDRFQGVVDLKPALRYRSL